MVRFQYVLPEIASDEELKPVTRAQFEDICRPLLDNVEETVKVALEQVKLSPRDITHVLCVGGSSLLPMVRRELTRFFRGGAGAPRGGPG